MEYFDLLNEDGSKTGRVKERNAVHRDGDLHGSVHIWMRSGNRILLQLRSRSRESFPGCCDVSSAGHISAGEDALTSAIRECREETGVRLQPSDLKELFRQRLDVTQDHAGTLFISHEINTVYLAVNDVSPSSIAFDPEETDGGKWVSISELDEMISSGSEKCCISQSEWEQVRKCL